MLEHKNSLSGSQSNDLFQQLAPYAKGGLDTECLPTSTADVYTAQRLCSLRLVNEELGTVGEQLSTIGRLLCFGSRQLCTVSRELCTVSRQLCTVSKQLYAVRKRLCSASG